MQDVIFNKLLEVSNVSRYPGVKLQQVESISDHATQLGLIAMHIVRDLSAVIDQYPDCKDLRIDLSSLALKALFYDLNIDGYQIGGPKDSKYYGYEIKTKLNLPFLYDFWQNMKDGTIESQIVQLADFMTVLRKCIKEIQISASANADMIPVAEELREHLIHTKDRIPPYLLVIDQTGKAKTIAMPLGVSNYLSDTYNKCLAMVNDVISSAKPVPETLAVPPVQTASP
jgi:hypothetical protein